MANLVKCPFCGIKDNRELMVKVGNRYWHDVCRMEYEKEQETKMSKEAREKERDKQEYKDLIEYICELFDCDKPNGIVFKQIKELHNAPYNYRYKAIQMALEYFFDIKNNSTAKARGIGIVPYIYDEAAEFYTNLVTISNANLDKETEKAKEIKIKKPVKNLRKKKNKFNLNDI
ncbi:hypothetical protein [Staphylococcus chromogenes]|uniref:hypothetical protein n=1 Tax=Staphylococcus chromogenes TaxID=46126 RepID=UPI00288AFEF0|nr:hypothetical protein [Staphylococcus chromogenes]